MLSLLNYFFHPKVKAQCLRLLANLKPDPARMQLISGFVDTYIKLNRLEESEFKQEISIFIQTEVVYLRLLPSQFIKLIEVLFRFSRNSNAIAPVKIITRAVKLF